MLHQVSWQLYGFCVLSLLVCYYVYVGIVYFRAEGLSFFYRLAGKQLPVGPSRHSVIPTPEYEVMGPAINADQDEPEDELIFANEDDQDESTTSVPPAAPVFIRGEQTQNNGLTIVFSEMASEVKTLLRVIMESKESKANFEMLFKLVLQKYPEITGTNYEKRINHLVLAQEGGELPFPLTPSEIENYWSNH